MIRGLAEKLGLTDGPRGDARAEHALDRARGSRDSRVRPVVPTARQITRRQNRTAATDARKRRRQAFLRAQQQKTDQTLHTWARVYLEGAGNDHVRRNVTAAAHRQAELYSQAHGEPFTTSLKRVEGVLLTALHAQGLATRGSLR